MPNQPNIGLTYSWLLKKKKSHNRGFHLSLGEFEVHLVCQVVSGLFQPYHLQLAVLFSFLSVPPSRSMPSFIFLRSQKALGFVHVFRSSFYLLQHQLDSWLMPFQEQAKARSWSSDRYQDSYTVKAMSLTFIFCRPSSLQMYLDQSDLLRLGKEMSVWRTIVLITEQWSFQGHANMW